MTLTADHRAALIGACPLFQGLVPVDLDAVAAAAIEVEFPAERVINSSFIDEANKKLGPFELKNKASKLPGCQN